MLENKLFAQVKQLGFKPGTYALFGSAPLAARGLRECRDIDVVMTEEAWNECAAKPEWKPAISALGSECLQFTGAAIELFKDWKPGEWDVAELIRDAEIVDGLPYVRLESVIRSKELMGRPKDMEDLKLIAEFLKRA